MHGLLVLPRMLSRLFICTCVYFLPLYMACLCCRHLLLHLLHPHLHLPRAVSPGLLVLLDHIAWCCCLLPCRPQVTQYINFQLLEATSDQLDVLDMAAWEAGLFAVCTFLNVAAFLFWVVYIFEIIQVEVDALRAQQEVRQPTAALAMQLA